MKADRAAWALLQPSLDPAKLVFLYETGASTKSARLRKAAARTVAALETAIAAALEAFSPEECANYFANSGYEPK